MSTGDAPVGVTAYHHVQLGMPAGREADAHRFYVDALGLQEVPRPPSMAGRGGAWYRSAAGVEVHLGVEDGFRPARKAHPALTVDDLDVLADRLRAAGYEVGATSADGVPGWRRFHAFDVFGNRLEFLQRA